MNSCQCSIMFAPTKYEYISANFSRCMVKGLRKEIILCSRLRNRFLKTKTEKSKQLHNKQRNLFYVKPKGITFLI